MKYSKVFNEIYNKMFYAAYYDGSWKVLEFDASKARRNRRRVGSRPGGSLVAARNSGGN